MLSVIREEARLEMPDYGRLEERASLQRQAFCSRFYGNGSYIICLQRTLLRRCFHVVMAGSGPPSKATDAVLVHSAPIPNDAREVKGIDWAALPTETRSIISSFVLGLSEQGFQSSSIGDAIRIINNMVCQY